jgi:hypothetical protein
VTGRRVARVLGAAGVLALAPLARADAPTDQYNLFNLNSVVIQDLGTGLTWQRYASTATVSFADAATTCAALSLDTFTTGWRVPSYKELLTIVDEVPHTEYPGGVPVTTAIDANAFPGTDVQASYWSSSVFPSTGATPLGYSVDFSSGVPQQDNALHLLHVRCVHD